MSTYEANRYSFSGANITALNGSNIASGTVADARIPDLATSKITSGTFADARISSSSVTAHVSAVTQATGSWTPTPSDGTFYSTTGRYFRVGNHVTVVAHGLFGDNSSGRTDNNDNLWYMSGLPVTSANVGTVVGGGISHFGSMGGNVCYPTVIKNTTEIRFYNNGAAMGTDTDANSVTSMGSFTSNTGYQLSNKPLRGSSNGESGDYFWVYVTYQV